MTTEIDLRGATDADAVGDRIDEVLDGRDVGEPIDLLADRNVEADLLSYQIEHDVELERAYESTGADVWELTVTHRGDTGEGERPAFDARDLPPQQRHSTLTAAFDDLAVDEGFRLVNDHDPKPLNHELNSTRGDVVGWEYLEEGGGEWIVEIVKTGDAAAGDDDVVTRFDVREIPKRERHPTIHHRYGMLPEGGTMELIAPHVPRPLQREFRGRYGDGFEWSLVGEEPGRAKVRITKREAEAADGQAADAGGGAGPEHDDATCGHHTDHVHGHEHDQGHDQAHVQGQEHANDHPADGEGGRGDAAAGSGKPSDTLDVVEEFDVRGRPPAERHEAIYEAYAALEPGEAFVFVNDHDPKPLYHQFDAEAGPEFRWEYRDKSPGEFRVLVGRAEDAAAPDGAEPTDGGAEAPF